MNVTGVYIGLLERQKKEISSEDGELAHLDESLPLHIRYVATSSDCEFMLNQVLSQDNGPITFSAFSKHVVDEETQEATETEGTVYVEDVIRNSEMFYFDVPKLGSYICIPCIYQSCLFEESFDSALLDY